MSIKKSSNYKKHNLYFIVVILALSSMFFRLSNDLNLEQSSIVFIALPALITVLTIKYSKTPKTPYGIVASTITIFLLMTTVLFGEGFICILMASPLFYGIPLIIVAISQNLKKKNKDQSYSFVIIPVLLILAQPLELFETPETQTISTSLIVDRQISIESLNESPNFNTDLPSFFNLGFPKPLDIKGIGTEVGDTRTIRFESNTRGIGSLTLEIITKTDSSITFNTIEDNTHINHWLTWKEINVTIKNISDNKTQITWTSNYTCDLGPSWYFEPMEKYAVEKMNVHLINSYFNE